jgi:hypothetical protein
MIIRQDTLALARPRNIAGLTTVGLLLALGVMSAPGCETGPQFTPEAQPLGDDVMKLATIYKDRIVFPTSAKAQLSEVAIGDVLVSGYDDGLIRRVDAIDAEKDTIVLRTSEASLTDAVVNGSTEVTIEPNAGEASLEPTPQPQAFLGQTFSTNLSGLVIHSDEGVTLRIKEGSLMLNAGIDVGIDIRDRRVQSVRAITSADMKIDITTEVEGRFLTKIHEEKILWKSPEFNVPLPPIGPVPVKASGRLVITGIFDGEADGQISVQVRQTFEASGEMGLRYTDGSGFERVRSFSPNWTLENPLINAEARLSTRAALRAELQLGLYGGIGPLSAGGGVSLWTDPFLSAHAQASDASDWGVDAGLDVGARAKLKVLWKDFPTEDYTTNVITKQLLPQSAGDSVPSSAGDCANGVEDGFETDADCGGSCAAHCGDGQECASNEDCDTGACDGGACVPVTCANGMLDAGEGDVDCGGGCPACEGDTCAQSWDCASELCEMGTCIEPYECQNGALDDGEEAVDCGGECDPCVDEEVPLGCDNGVRDGDEEDVDCSGSCPPCGGPVCGDGYCDAGEDDLNCPGDCGQPVCGDGACDVTENEVDCPGDCGGGGCGDGMCDFNGSEPVECPDDCCGDGYCDPGEDAVCAQDCVVCGDGVCDFMGTEPTECPQDCCGDGYCDPGEDAVCAQDCVVCGDGVCDFMGTEPAECPQDCCGDGYCDPGEDAVCPADCG